MNSLKEINKEKAKNITKKSKSNFLYSFIFLNKNKRLAIDTVYAFCRYSDDIVDSDDKKKEEKLILLEEWRNEFKKCLEKESKIKLLNDLSKVIKEFKIDSHLFVQLLEGMKMDLEKNRYSTFEELKDYCYHVASTVGLISIEIFGYEEIATRDYAVNLGIALQLTNILRDIKADMLKNRIYLPLEDLKKFKYSEKDLEKNVYNKNFIELMKYECKRANDYYERADTFLCSSDRENFVTAQIMEKIYHKILVRIKRKKYNVFTKFVGIPKIKKLYIAYSYFLKYKVLHKK